MAKMPANLPKRTLPDSHLQTIVDKQPKKQFLYELSRTYISCIN